MSKSWSTANSFAELAERLPKTGPLGAPLEEVVFQIELPPRVRADLARAAREQQLTVGDFLEERGLHRDLSGLMRYGDLLGAFKAWFSNQAVPSAPAPTGDARERLREALAATGLPDIGQFRPSDFDPQQTHFPYEELQGKSGAHFPPAAVAQWAASLERFTTHLERARAIERSAPPLIEAPHMEGDDALARIRRAAAQLRQPTLAIWPRGLFVSNCEFTIEQGQVFASPGRALRHGLALRFGALGEWVKRPQLACPCRQNPCVHRAGVLDALLETTLNPASPVTRSLVAELLPRWERAFEEFLSAEDHRSQKETEAPGALSFVFEQGDFEPRFHAMGKRGLSKAGKPIRRWEELAARLTGADRRIAEAFARASLGSGRFVDDPAYGDAVLLLAGHPNVIDGDDRTPLEVVHTEARIAVEDLEEQGLHVRFFVGPEEVEGNAVGGFSTSSGSVVPVRVGARLELVKVSAAFENLAYALARHGATLPREAMPKLAALLPRLEGAAKLDLPEELKGEEKAPLARVVARVTAAPQGVVLALRVEPLAAGPLFVPGHGAALSAAFDGTRRTFARRDFSREAAEAASVAGALGLDPSTAEDLYTWHLEPGDRHVETLRRLAQLAEGGLQVEWQAPKPRFTREATLDKLRLSIAKSRDWFGLEGDVEVDDRRVALAELLEAARARRRWVKLADNSYAQLSERLVEQLTPLAHLAEAGKAPTLTLGTVPLIEALAAQVGEVTAVEGWTRLTEKLAKAQEKPWPLPRGLKAELRDYQVEGYRWLARLADWGAGAVLADDMGLGKTLQALTLLLARGAQGPQLVVAPASVLHNWRVEAQRFAPSLELLLFHEGDRALEALGPKQVVVVSWALLQREAERFAATRFATVVFDEAHAIKNAGTQRARAAHRLQADFMVALSGTPVENHVGELWSLLRAVMPSLLGSEESFRKRFASGTPDAVKALSALVKPFILRRSKAQVAQELPPRTDLDLVVPLSDAERALYDDVRLSAVKGLGELSGESQRFEVLAALTRLRLTACHPKLVDPAWSGPTSKLSRLLELVKDLAASGHKVLVFSQFTAHLALVSEALREAGLTFSSLDGQVPLLERQRRVEAFQKGAGGDLFLISLKAGGTGLTLTAADYVIHLDPWWNPAVEDQASDRAHRIGQDRPVTVYRLIAEGTIEQQILALHKDKRDLVDALLSGTDTAGKLSATELAALIRSGA